MVLVADEGSALFSGLNATPKKELDERRHRVNPH